MSSFTVVLRRDIIPVSQNAGFDCDCSLKAPRVVHQTNTMLTDITFSVGPDDHEQSLA